MTIAVESVLDEVRHKLGPLNEQAEQAVAQALEIIRKKIAPPATGNFINRNASLQEYLTWPDKRRRRYHSEAEEANAAWVEKKLRELNAMWLIVVEGEVIAHGHSFQKFPHEEEFDELCDRLGKYPFVFFSPRMFLIEETTRWHPTEIPGDAYPTIPLGLKSDTQTLQLDADFDTGALDIYLDLDYLTANGITTVTEKNLTQDSRHLGRLFSYIAKSLWLEMADKNGIARRIRVRALCVLNWAISPFTAINPNRRALIGRNVLFELRPRAILDFNDRSTEIEFPSLP